MKNQNKEREKYMGLLFSIYEKRKNILMSTTHGKELLLKDLEV